MNWGEPFLQAWQAADEAARERARQALVDAAAGTLPPAATQRAPAPIDPDTMFSKAPLSLPVTGL